MSDNQETKREVIICECHSLEHQVIFHYDKEWDEISMSVHLHEPSFWRRLKYLFGYKSRFGAWDEVLVSREKLQRTLEKIIEETKKESDV